MTAVTPPSPRPLWTGGDRDMLSRYAPSATLVCSRARRGLRGECCGDLQMDRCRWRGSLLGSSSPRSGKDRHVVELVEWHRGRGACAVRRRTQQESAVAHRIHDFRDRIAGEGTGVLRRRNHSGALATRSGTQAESDDQLVLERQPAYRPGADIPLVHPAVPVARHLPALGDPHRIGAGEDEIGTAGERLAERHAR